MHTPTEFPLPLGYSAGWEGSAGRSKGNWGGGVSLVIRKTN
jgi:hypothetical protein